MIEQKTEYYSRLRKTDCYFFTNLWLMCSEYKKELPQLSDDFYFDALKQGGRNLTSRSQMTNYLGYWGRFYNFMYSYPYDDFDSYSFCRNQEINIIDYGCGQAIWSMLYAYYLNLGCYDQFVNAITLIEPSELLLKRAALHARVSFPFANIKTVNKKLDDLEQNDIICDDNIPTLHIFSDILERRDFDMDRLAGLVKNSLKGKDQFLCVQLYFGNYQEDNRVRKFASIFADEYYYGSIPQRDMDLLNGDYPILNGTKCIFSTFGDFDWQYRLRKEHGH